MEDYVESDMVGRPVERYTSRKAERFENLDLTVNCLQDEVDEDDVHGIEVLWEDPINHPHCPHGPTLLFTRYVKDDVERYYGCSACRDRKSCTFFLRFGQEMPKLQKHQWKLERQKLAQHYDHQQLYIRFNKLMTKPVAQRRYCHGCEKLILNFEKHQGHKIMENVTGYQMYHPTELLQPLENEKKEAQYFFSKKTVEDIVNMLLKLEAKQILCIGTPRIHEYIMGGHHKYKMSSLLLDIDGRFHNFFGPMDYCWYNLFNHHFFNNDAVSVFKDFLTQNGGRDTYLICDPPFGGHLEPISYTIKMISDLYKKLNKQVSNDDFFLKIMFIHPYYMENVMKMKSSPPHVTGGLKDLKMSDYKVDYDNHPTFISKENGTEQGSLARIFTNVPLNLLKFPSSDGYKFCQKCKKRFSSESEYGNKCKECISNSGQTYKYCDLCKRNVNPTWVHCQICRRCALEEHTCSSNAHGSKPNIWRKCLICDQQDHTYKQCTKLLNLLPTETTADCETNIKKSNTDCYLKTSSNEKTKVKHPKKVIKQKAVIVDKESLKTEKDKNLKSKSHNK